MSLAFSTSPSLVSRILPQWRIPLTLGTLGAILYYTIYLAVGVPYLGIDLNWTPEGGAVIGRLSGDSPAQGRLQAGDVVLAIDGVPVRRIDWQPLFNALKPSYAFSLQRGSQHLELEIPVLAPSFTHVLERMTASIVGLAAWAIGALIVLFASPRNRDAWQIGIVSFGMAGSLVASEAAQYGVPGAWLGSTPIFPLVGVAFAEVALLPRLTPPAQRDLLLFRGLYAIAIALGALSVFEIVSLSPRATSIEALTGISLNDFIELFMGAGFVANPMIAAGRWLRTPPSYLREQILILLVATALGILPLVLLYLVPVNLLRMTNPPLSWPVTLLLLLIIPATYGYVIYRRKYLGLDLFATQTFTWLALGLYFITLYTLVLYIVQHRLPTVLPQPLLSILVLALVFAAFPYVGPPFRRAVQALLFGPELPYQEALHRFTSALSGELEFATLKRILKELADLLQVRQAALLLTGRNGAWECLEGLRVEPTLSIPFAEGAFDSLIVRSATTESESWPPILKAYPWVEIAAPLRVGSSSIGLLLLGQRVPDGNFNARQVTFVQQVANEMAVAAQASSLFESSLAMSRALLRVRDAERRQLAARIHDEPLQHISQVIDYVDRILRQPGLNPEEAMDRLLTLRAQASSLRLAVAQLRDICAGLRPPILEQGIQYAIRAVVGSFHDQTGLDVRLTVEVGSAVSIPEDVTTAFYHVLLEALNNIHRHADATRAWVRLARENGCLHLSVIDNGRGNPMALTSLPDLVRARHFGIVGMHEWAGLVQGRLELKARSEGGTEVVLEVPFYPSEN